MAEGIPQYDELKLRIEPGAEGTYRVRAFGPDGGTGSGLFERPFSDVELDNFVLRVGSRTRNVRSFRSSAMEEAKRFGSTLAEALLQGEVRETYSGARRVAEEHNRGLRITLYLTDVPELMEIPWEYLYDKRSFLSHSIYTPVVRSLDLTSGIRPRRVTAPLRIVGVVSSPQGFPPLDVAREKEKLEDALAGLRSRGLVELCWLETATTRELDRFISAPDEEHVLHYIGHGAYDTKTETGILVLEDEQGQPHEVTGEELSSLVQDERSLRLAVLNSCEGARSSHVDPFSGVASSLLHCGIPAVVGMQFEITDEAAIAFSERLYTAVAQGFPVDAALAQARKAIFAAGNDIEFGTPVLYLRGTDTQLFDVQTPESDGRTSAPIPDVTDCDFSVDLEQLPPEVQPGQRVAWTMTIRNTGAVPLRAVTASSDVWGALGDPVDLTPGGRNVIRWSEAADPEIRHVITITASGPDGSRVTEQVIAHVSAPAASRESNGAIAVPEPVDSERAEPVVSAPPDQAPDDNLELFDRHIEMLDGSVHPNQKKALRDYVNGRETLIGMSRAGNESDFTRPIVMIFTSERLIWCRETVFSSPDSGVADWSNVVSVEERSKRSGFELKLRGGGNFIADLINGGGVAIPGQQIGFSLEEVLAWIRRKLGVAAPVESPHAWTAELTNKGDRIRVLRVQLDHEAHLVSYRTGSLTDKVELDGQVLYKPWTPDQAGYELVLEDGDQSRTGRLRVELGASGMKIKRMTLAVEGQVLFNG